MGVRIQFLAGVHRGHDGLLTTIRRLAHAGPRRTRGSRLGLDGKTRKAD